MSSSARVLRLIAVNALVTLALLAVIELTVRAVRPQISPLGTSKQLVADSVFGPVHGPAPMSTGISNGAAFSVDHRGFWKYASDTTTSARSAWLLIGDSVTMGIGVQPDSTFGGLLAARLSPDVEILNPSWIGYSSSHYRELVRHFLSSPPLDERIRRITIMWCLNDAYRGRQVVDEGARPSARFEPMLNILRRNVYTYQWLKATFTDRPRRYFVHDSRLYDGPSLSSAIADLRAIAEECERSGVTCDVVLLPYEYQIRESIAEPQRTFADVIMDLPLPVHDPLPWMMERAEDSRSMYLYGDGIHFSENGHRLLAEYLLALVR